MVAICQHFIIHVFSPYSKSEGKYNTNKIYADYSNYIFVSNRIPIIVLVKSDLNILFFGLVLFVCITRNICISKLYLSEYFSSVQSGADVPLRD